MNGVDEFVLANQVRWALAYLLVFLGYKYLERHMSDRVRALDAASPPRWLIVGPSWLAIAFVFLLLLDEGGLLLRELGVTDPGGLFTAARYYMGIPWFAKLQEFFSHLLVFLFVFELCRDLNFRPSLLARVNLGILLIGLIFCFDFLQIIIWGTVRNFSVDNAPGILIGLGLYAGPTVAAYRDFSKRLRNSGEGESFAAAERRTLLSRILLCLALIFPLSQTLISRAILLWLIWRRANIFIRSHRSGPEQSEDTGHLHHVLTTCKPRDHWLIEAHYVLGLASVVPLCLLWRVLLTPDPPTVSFYQYPVTVSLGLSAFIVAFVFVIKMGRFSRRTLSFLALAYLASYAVFPITARGLFGIDRMFLSPYVLPAFERVYLIGTTVSILTFLAYLVFLLWERETSRFVFDDKPWGRLGRIPLLLYGCIAILSSAVLSVLLAFQPRAGSLGEAGMLLVLTLGCGAILVWGIISLKDVFLCKFIKVVDRGYRSRIARGSAEADALVSRFPWAAEGENQGLPRVRKLSGFSNFKRWLLLTVWGIPLATGSTMTLAAVSGGMGLAGRVMVGMLLVAFMMPGLAFGAFAAVGSLGVIAIWLFTESLFALLAMSIGLVATFFSLAIRD